VFIWGRVEFDCFPHQRIVCAKPVVAGCDLTTRPLAEQQRRHLLAVN
jgi:hypothetical protein